MIGEEILRGVHSRSRNRRIFEQMAIKPSYLLNCAGAIWSMDYNFQLGKQDLEEHFMFANESEEEE